MSSLQNSLIKQRRLIIGAGGGGKAGTGGAVAVEDPDTLQSRSTARALHLLGEGELELVDGLNSVLFDGTPVENEDGSKNFSNYTIGFAPGTQDQGALANFTDEENTQGVGVRLKKATPWVHSIAAGTADQTRIIIRFPRLQTQDKKTGDVHGTSVQIKIERDSGAGYSQVILDTVNGKASNPYLRSYLVDLPGEGPWQVRVTRVTADSTSEALNNDTYIETYSDITLSKLRHPNSSLLGIAIDAQYFSSIPTVATRVRKVGIKIPTNYDPVNRTYATSGPGTTGGAWDGTFKNGTSNNPAWCWYDVVTSDRYGLGDLFDINLLNKFALYDIGRYCDQLVPDGYGGMEPRFTCNLYIQERAPAMKVVQDMASIFRAMLTYINGLIVPIQDSPRATVTHQFTPDNVIDGEFAYAGTAGRARHTAAIVWWNNMDNYGIAEPLAVELQDEILRTGFYNEMTVTAFGCTSPGQAYRLGLWSLLTEKYNIDTVTFKTGQEGMSLLPGDYIEIQNPWRSGAELGGRLEAASNGTFTLDKNVVLQAGKSYFLQVVLSDGKAVSRPIITGAGSTNIVQVSPIFSSAPAVGTVWTIAVNDLALEGFIVLGQVPESDAVTSITAINYNASKYSEADLGAKLETPPTSKLPSAKSCLPPGDVTLTETAGYGPNGVMQRILHVSWIKSNDYYLRGYLVMYRNNNGNFIPLQESPSNAVDIAINATGNYDVLVYAVNTLGVKSQPKAASLVVDDTNPLSQFSIIGLELVGGANSLVFTGRDAHFQWKLSSPTMGNDEIEDDQEQSGTQDPAFSEFLLFVRDNVTKKIVFESSSGKVENTIYTYELNASSSEGLKRKFDFGVAAKDIYGLRSLTVWLNGVNNPAPAFLVGIDPSYAVLSLKVRYDTPTDLDWQGCLAWRSAFSGFTPSVDNQVFRGSENPMLIPQVAGSTFFYRFAAFDAFTQDPAFLNVSAEIQIENRYLEITDFTQELRDRFDLIEENAAAIILIQETIVNDEESFAQQIAAVIALTEDNSAAIIEEQTARTTADTAFADLLETVQATVDNNTALIAEEQLARADADSAIASDLSLLTVIVDENTASITAEHIAWVSAVAAEATTRQTTDATFTAKFAVRPNLLPNGGFELGTVGWTLLGGATLQILEKSFGRAAEWTPILNTLTYLVAEPQNVQVGGTYTLSFDAKFFAGTGTFKAYMIFKDAAGVTIATVIGPSINPGRFFDPTGQTRNAFSATAPANASTLTLQFRASVFTEGATQSAGVRLIKLEEGTLPATPYTAEGGIIANAASVVEETAARIDAFGQVYLQWGVHLDVNGRIIGLINLSGDNATSAFIVAANAFRVVDPSNTVTPITVFAVYTTAGARELIVGAPERSSNFIAGSTGARIDWQTGDAEFNKITYRDAIVKYTVGQPTFTNDYTGDPIQTSFTYDEDTQLSVRFHTTSSPRRIRISLVGEVTLDSPFIGWYRGNHVSVTGVSSVNGSPTLTRVDPIWHAVDLHKPISGSGIPVPAYIGVINSPTSIGLSSSPTTNVPIDATTTSTRTVTIGDGGLEAYDGDELTDVIAGREGGQTGSSDYIGFIQSDGATSTFKRTTLWRVRTCDDPDGDGSYSRMGPESTLTTTYVPVDTNAWPIVPKPYVYTLASDANGVRGTDTTYKVRADCNDTVATLKVSTDGDTYLTYTRGNVRTLDVGENVYFKATRPKYRDSPVTEFSNTTSSVPTSGGHGDPGNDSTKSLP